MNERRKRAKFLWTAALAWLCMLALAAASFYQLRQFSYARAVVYNVSDRQVFEAASMPNFIHQTPDAPKLLHFRQHIDHLINTEADEITKLVAVQHWVRSQESYFQFYLTPSPILDGTEDPEEILQQQQRGSRGSCRRFSYIATGAFLSAGLDARPVVASGTLDRTSHLAHALVEVRIQKLNKWILIDPTNDAFVLVDGQPASLLEVYDAAQPGSQHKISFDRHGTDYRMPPLPEYRGYFRHLFVANTNAIFDGYHYGLLGERRIGFVHYVAPGTEPYPQDRRNMLLAVMLAAAGSTIVLTIQILVFVSLSWLHKVRPSFWRSVTRKKRSRVPQVRPSVGLTWDRYWLFISGEDVSDPLSKTLILRRRLREPSNT